MGQVRLARDETLVRDVAIKEIDQPLGGDSASSARRTLREARAAARISHPNVVQVYDVLQLDDRTWIVMEYVRSRSLREEIAERGRLDPYRVARIGLDLLAALRTAHRLGVEHRDVKPANVLLADDGRVLLTDFGIAAVDDDGVISRSDILVGSPQFMAPERAQSGAGGREADLWSLGATLYAAIEGQAPYQRSSTMATLAALATEDPDPPKHAGSLRPLLDGLLRKNPAIRLTAEDAESLLRTILANLSPESGPNRRADGRVPHPRAASDPLPAAGAAGATGDGEPGDALAPEDEALPGESAIVAGGADEAGRPKDAAGEGAPAADPVVGGAMVRAAPGRPRRLILVAVATVVVLLTGGIWLFTGRGGGTPAADEKKTGATATAGTPEATPSRAPESAPATQPAGDGRPVLPAGWELYTDRTGFSLYVPKGWRRTKEGTLVYFRGDGKVLGIDQTNKPRSNPVADWREQARNRVSGGDFPGYREVRIEAVDYFRKAADWEFTFNRGGARQHVNNRGTVVHDDKAYGFYWQTRDDVWAGSRKDLQLVFDSFRPAR
ncbi:serine/threonine protein kinase [Actinoplanes lobatus]|nr:serine/threonine protein kinase [Actinoplanes lobatus]GIE44170.1 serine/threonine protein kinase [Actinoplanes lobatus]